MIHTARVVALVLLAGGWILTAACRPSMERAEADRLAQARLEEYSEREGLTLSNFSSPRVTDQGRLWLYNYEYAGPREYLVAIIVHRGGRTELSRMIEEKNAP